MSEKVARWLPDRPLVIPLAYAVGDTLDLVAPGGTQLDDTRPDLIAFGPLTTSVLGSLWRVGYPALSQDVEQLEDAIGQALGAPSAHGPDGRPVPSIQRALVLWKVFAALGQLAEEVAALVSAIDEWHQAGYPRGTECGIGRAYLRWDTHRSGGIEAALRPYAERDAVLRLLGYPDSDELALELPHEAQNLISRLCDESANLVASAVAQLLAAMTPALWRTFIRHKHRVTATSPGSAPLWIPKQGPEEWAAADMRFASGFGVIDWQRSAAQPELVLWPAEDQDLGVYSRLMRVSLDLFGLLLASLVRFSVKGADPLPLVQRGDRDLSAAEEAALTQLARSDYLAVALARRTTPAA
jgi:hypothetical protein